MIQLFNDYTGSNGVDRRSVLKVTGIALTGSALVAGTAAARAGGSNSSGQAVGIGGGQAHTYTERAHGRLSALGIEFDAAALTDLPGSTTEYHLGLPRGDTGRFEWAGVDWNPAGHEPPFMYGHPHFDFHFYMVDEETVEAIPPIFPPDTVPYDIPDALMPEGTYTTADLPPGAASPRAVVPAMGEHLVSLTESMPFGSPVWNPGNPAPDGWSVYIWGAYDPDGDGTGQMIFMEPMITVAYFEDLMGDGSADAEDVSSIPMPERFLKAGRYPTEYVVRYHSDDGTFTVSLESFEQFRGYGRR